MSIFTSRKYEKLAINDNFNESDVQQEYVPRKMPGENMEDIELKDIDLQVAVTRTLSKEGSFDSQKDERVETDYGYIQVSVQGDRNKPAILTFHDIGLNSVSSFQAFFNYEETRILMQNFCTYHINAPGQEEGAANLDSSYVFPDMDQLADMIIPVLKHFNVKHFIGLGSGAGANILTRFALLYPEKVDALCLINSTCSSASWTEWGYQKLNSLHLRNKGMTASTLDYLMWHHFGKVTEERNYDLIQVYKNYFEKQVNTNNLALFISSYIRRSDLGLVRELDMTKRKSAKMLKNPVLAISGILSPHLEAMIDMNGKLDPSSSNFLKLSDCGMVLEEKPGKVIEALRLFLQGLGYVSSRRKSTGKAVGTTAPNLTARKVASRTADDNRNGNIINEEYNSTAKQEVHIVENPIGQHQVIC